MVSRGTLAVIALGFLLSHQAAEGHKRENRQSTAWNAGYEPRGGSYGEQGAVGSRGRGGSYPADQGARPAKPSESYGTPPQRPPVAPAATAGYASIQGLNAPHPPVHAALPSAGGYATEPLPPPPPPPPPPVPQSAPVQAAYGPPPEHPSTVSLQLPPQPHLHPVPAPLPPQPSGSYSSPSHTAPVHPVPASVPSAPLYEPSVPVAPSGYQGSLPPVGTLPPAPHPTGPQHSSVHSAAAPIVPVPHAPVPHAPVPHALVPHSNPSSGSTQPIEILGVAHHATPVVNGPQYAPVPVSPGYGAAPLSSGAPPLRDGAAASEGFGADSLGFFPPFPNFPSYDDFDSSFDFISPPSFRRRSQV